jgi:hypothetical protein
MCFLPTLSLSPSGHMPLLRDLGVYDFLPRLLTPKENILNSLGAQILLTSVWCALLSLSLTFPCSPCRWGHSRHPQAWGPFWRTKQDPLRIW